MFKLIFFCPLSLDKYLSSNLLNFIIINEFFIKICIDIFGQKNKINLIWSNIIMMNTSDTILMFQNDNQFFKKYSFYHSEVSAIFLSNDIFFFRSDVVFVRKF